MDQGQEGACVGFGWTHELLAWPKKYVGLDDSFAQRLYLEAQTRDEWDGEDYDGTSVLAGAKVVQARGFMESYRWGFSLDDVLRSIGYAGPVVIGVNWYTGMMDTDLDGFIRPTGVVEGGHCIMVYSVSVRQRLVRLLNSWGGSWGTVSGITSGVAYMTWDDLWSILSEQGETCIPVGRLSQPVVG